MKIDPNDISGFISGCDNIAYLVSLQNHVAERLTALGYKGALAIELPLPSLPGVSLAEKKAKARVEQQEEKAIESEQPTPLFVEEKVHLMEVRKEESKAKVNDFTEMPDYSKMPQSLRVILESKWKEKNSASRPKS